MRYLLDSNICIAILNKRTSQVLEVHVDTAIQRGDGLYIATIVLNELWFGVAKSHRVQANSSNLSRFLQPPFHVLEFDRTDARTAGEIRAELARRGTPIGPYDTLIAGQALARGLTLVTANTREFARVDGLKLANWTE
jgi:tRNA(fMet)-specific endonuclease VapC